MPPSYSYVALLGSIWVSRVLAQNASCIAKQPPGYVSPVYGFTEPFTPYLAPNGTTSFDDTDTSGVIKYNGQWTSTSNPRAVNSTLHVTDDTSASVSFTFTGSGIEWFGATGQDQGVAKVTLDGNEEEVNAFSTKRYEQQRLWSKLDLPVRKHKLTIQNTAGHGNGHSLSLDAFVVTAKEFSIPARVDHADGWSLVQKGSTGVGAMQLIMISETHALILDKTEHNYLSIDGHPAWGVLYDIETHKLQPLALESNSFCAAGSFLSNGTLVSVGGDRPAIIDDSPDEFNDVDGRQSIRILEPCLGSTEECHILDMVGGSPVIRWYPTTLRITDGSILIIGGNHENVFMNNFTINEPTTSFFPSLPSSPITFDFPFLNRTLNANLFPHAFSLPGKRAFVIANSDSIFYNWGASPPVEEEKNYPLPNGVRVTYPMGGIALMLPLSSKDNYTSTILVCGGSDAFDMLCNYEYSSKYPASKQCARIEIKRDGTTDGWKLDDSMPVGLVMPDGVLLPTGEVVIMNGASAGYMGFGSVVDPDALSNARDPLMSPIVYSPDKPSGERFHKLGVRSDIPRLYHSVASLTPRGDVMITGSNPNPDRTVVKYPTDFRVEWLRPPYMDATRPTYKGLPERVDFGAEFTLDVQIPSSLDSSKIKVSLVDTGYSTHSLHVNTRLVFLDAKLKGKQLTVTAPPDAGVYPPGPGYIFVVVDGIASKGSHILIGDGKAPAPH